MSLEKYNEKRNFTQTTEPKGFENRSEGRLKFVVQRHLATHLHYDFRLEMDGVLKSWAVPKGPSLNVADKRLAVMVEDHPYDYRTFEGEIPEGNYGAGVVEIWDEGTYEGLDAKGNPVTEHQLITDFKAGSFKFYLQGNKLQGEFSLLQMKNTENNKNWLLKKSKDAFTVDKPYNAEKYTPVDSKVTIALKKRMDEKKAFKNVSKK